MRKKLWNILSCSENPWTEGWVSIDAERIATVEATDEEIKTLIEADWNPPILEDTYGEKCRMLEAEPIVSIPLKYFLNTPLFKEHKHVISMITTENRGSE